MRARDLHQTPVMPMSGRLTGGFVRWGRDLTHEISDDHVSIGAAALAYYLFLAIFPALISLLTLIPYLPIRDLDHAILDFMRQALPSEAATLLSGTVTDVVSQRRGGLLSFGLLATFWAASNGMYALMQQLNVTYDVEERRSFIKVRATALLLTLLFGGLVIATFALVVLGGKLQGWLGSLLGLGSVLLFFFAVARWAIILAALLTGFAIIYYLGPDVRQKFRWVSPGAILGTALLLLAALALRVYVAHFANYNATYGSLGAVMILMLWLYVMGLVILVGSEINALVEHRAPTGKAKGHKELPST